MMCKLGRAVFTIFSHKILDYDIDALDKHRKAAKKRGGGGRMKVVPYGEEKYLFIFVFRRLKLRRPLSSGGGV